MLLELLPEHTWEYFTTCLKILGNLALGVQCSDFQKSLVAEKLFLIFLGMIGKRND